MRALLPVLPGPSRYAGIEEGTCHKDPATVRLRVGLAFPDTYDVGMSYLGQKILYGIVNKRPQWLAERVMAPDREAGALLRKHNTLLSTLESDILLKDLHCVSFSITHELCYTNVLYMLDLAGIPLRSNARSQDLLACPLVIAGGGALLSAEPLTPFVDVMVLGDGEESLPDILELLEDALQKGLSRDDFLREARHIPGVYVPSLFRHNAAGGLEPLYADYTRPARRIVADLNDAAYPTRQVVPIGAVHNRLSLEIARGCTRGCRFCHAGMVYRPVRERSLENITTLLQECLAETGFDEISFLSLSTGDFSALKTLSHSVLESCSRAQVGLSLPSLRVGSIDDEIIEKMAELRRTGCTLAPEAGSQRLRDVINKGVSEEDLLLHIQKLLEHGWRQVKLYFMIGLPTETDDDLLAIVDLCRKVRDAAGRNAPRMQVTAALSPFVPKPFTPFQWDAQISQDEIRRRVYFVRDCFKGQKFLKMRWHEPAMSHLEGVLSRADRQMADVVEKAYHKGAIFCSWMDGFTLAPWQEALAECGISAESCIGAREPGTILPWSHLEAGVSEDFLLRERERALAEKITDDCRYGACRQCGACDTLAGPSRLPHTNLRDGNIVPHHNRLIFPQRDQKAHAPARDEEGRLICRTVSSKPPKLAPELAVKAVQYRVWHTKTGGSAYLSQLELQAVLDRALRRAALPLAFSQGFHPLPLLSFGRALPVSVQSFAEWFALTLHKHLSPEEVMASLAPTLPPGMELLGAEKTDASRRTELAAFETFSIDVEGVAAQAIAGCFADFWTLERFEHCRETKKGPRSADIRPLLHAWQPPTSSDVGHTCGAGQANGTTQADNAEHLGTTEQTNAAKPILQGTASRTVTFEMDRRTLYLSPLLFCLAILRPLGDDDFLRPRLRLTKTAQTFADGRRYP